MTAPPTQAKLIQHVDRTRISDQIFRRLKDEIVAGTLPRGAKLPAERELAERYQVSNPTVREAVRALDLLGFVDVKHGSGAYVSVDPTALIATSMAVAIQLTEIGVVQVLSVFGALSQHAAALAAEAATPGDHAMLRSTLAAVEAARTAEAAASALRDFHGAVAAASHNPLLAALCQFLARIQIELGVELAGGSSAVWRKVLATLRPARRSLVEAIISRDREQAGALAQEFHRSAVDAVTSLPKAKEIRLADPMLHTLLSSTMGRIVRS